MQIRRARESDLPAVVALLADDALGQARESSGAEPVPAYRRAFAAIVADPSHEILVAEEGALMAVLQLSFLPNLTYTGGLRAQIEGVRVAEPARGTGVGRALMNHAIERARMCGCVLIQLTCDKERPDAHRFYESLGFVASHEGFKLRLEAAQADSAFGGLTDEPVTDDAVDRALKADLEAWTVERTDDGKSAILRSYEFPTFEAAIGFMGTMAAACGALNHHPEQKNVYRRLHVTLTTHSAGNRVTALDLELARRHEAAFVALTEA